VRSVRFAADGRVRQGWAEGEGEGLVLRDESGRAFPPSQAVWLPPVEPGTVLAVALNYADHAVELALAQPPAPALFLKPVHALVGHGGAVVLPRGVRHLHYEGELAVVIGRPARRVPRAHALEYVRGYTVANDVTARDFVADVFRPPTKAKGWDTFLPLGPWLVEGEIADPGRLAIRTLVNGEVRQEGTTADMVYSVADLIAYASEFLTLMPGDVFLTGTPRGIAPVRAGDVIRVEIEGVGALENRVVAEEETDWAPPGGGEGGTRRG
jgi:5-oxopent-3-ene-1,2,5-tricarboxylate decarboxylase/2-hydroxyhepta-2,4-diene-1,7-dioate isomerase